MCPLPQLLESHENIGLPARAWRKCLTVYRWGMPALDNVSVTHAEVPCAPVEIKRVVSAVSRSCLHSLDAEEQLKTSKPGCHMRSEVTPTPRCLHRQKCGRPARNRAVGPIPAKATFSSASSQQATGVSGKEGL